MDERLNELNTLNADATQTEVADDGVFSAAADGQPNERAAGEAGEKTETAQVEQGGKKKKKKLSKRATKLIINIAVIVVLVAVTLAILLTSYEELNFENIWEFIKSSNGWFIAAAVVCMLLSILFEAVNIYIISSALGSKPKIPSAIAYATSDVYYSAITPSATGGQPAAMFYMVRDGIPAGTAGFTLVFDVTLYATAIVSLGIFSICVRPDYFMKLGNHWAQVLWVFGIVVQLMLVLLSVVCMLWSKAILKLGNWIISLLTKMKIVKRPDKWRGKLTAEVEKYAANRQIIKKHPFMCICTFLFNLGQRIAHTLITCFIVYAADPNSASFLDIFVMQLYVLIGYNSIPLPGGVGAYEVMYLSTYGICFGDSAFILSAMMVSRVISFYIRMTISGLYTLCYHAIGIKKNPRYGDDEDAPAEQAQVADGINADEPAQEEQRDIDTSDNDEAMNLSADAPSEPVRDAAYNEQEVNGDAMHE